MPLKHETIHRHAIPRQELKSLSRPKGTDTHLPNRSIRQHKPGGFRLQLSQLLQCKTRAEAGALLKESSQQDKTQQHHRLVEKTGPPHLGPDQGNDAGGVGTANPQSHQGVHAGSTGTSRGQASTEDRSARADKRHRGQHSMEGEAPDEGESEMARFADVTQDRKQQQRQRHHQLSPLLPPGQP